MLEKEYTDLDYTSKQLVPNTNLMTDMDLDENEFAGNTDELLRISNGGTADKLHFKFESSCDKLFFVKFTPANTLRPRWYLVQVVPQDSDETPLPPGIFFCTFLQKHPKDSSKCDDVSRWWPEWRELLWDDNNDYEFGDRILFSPTQKPNLHLFGKFGTEINFDAIDTVLVGPFEFLSKTSFNPGNSYISNDQWELLYDACLLQSLAPPMVSTKPCTTVALASTIRNSINDINYSSAVVEHSSLTSLSVFFKNKKGTLRPSHNVRKPVDELSDIA